MLGHLQRGATQNTTDTAKKGGQPQNAPCRPLDFRCAPVLGGRRTGSLNMSQAASGVLGARALAVGDVIVGAPEGQRVAWHQQVQLRKKLACHTPLLRRGSRGIMRPGATCVRPRAKTIREDFSLVSAAVAFTHRRLSHDCSWNEPQNQETLKVKKRRLPPWAARISPVSGPRGCM